ncbi:hypothetical protein BCR39DRAFT_507055 [Naematelia encephala]|uniref:Uncharacterized protein n=1 Tax=Naematelia encephala TaxID=71784 RepID=A0A1Y2ASM0_9TREE|nr:hypothetical protein BCR39DRAFT_507055 [Naematelia encephala]
MSSVHALLATKTDPSLVLRPGATEGGFPLTGDHDASPFHFIQSGSTRTLMPTFTSLQQERQYRKEHLVLVFRASHRAGLAEGIAGSYGHTHISDDFQVIVLPETPFNPTPSRSIRKQSPLLVCAFPTCTEWTRMEMWLKVPSPWIRVQLAFTRLYTKQGEEDPVIQEGQTRV